MGGDEFRRARRPSFIYAKITTLLIGRMAISQDICRYQRFGIVMRCEVGMRDWPRARGQYDCRLAVGRPCNRVITYQASTIFPGHDVCRHVSYRKYHDDKTIPRARHATHARPIACPILYGRCCAK